MGAAVRRGRAGPRAGGSRAWRARRRAAAARWDAAAPSPDVKIKKNLSWISGEECAACTAVRRGDGTVGKEGAGGATTIERAAVVRRCTAAARRPLPPRRFATRASLLPPRGACLAAYRCRRHRPVALLLHWRMRSVVSTATGLPCPSLASRHPTLVLPRERRLCPRHQTTPTVGRSREPAQPHCPPSPLAASRVHPVLNMCSTSHHRSATRSPPARQAPDQAGEEQGRLALGSPPLWLPCLCADSNHECHGFIFLSFFLLHPCLAGARPRHIWGGAGLPGGRRGQRVAVGGGPHRRHEELHHRWVLGAGAVGAGAVGACPD